MEICVCCHIKFTENDNFVCDDCYHEITYDGEPLVKTESLKEAERIAEILNRQEGTKAIPLGCDKVELAWISIWVGNERAARITIRNGEVEPDADARFWCSINTGVRFA